MISVQVTVNDKDVRGGLVKTTGSLRNRRALYEALALRLGG